MATPTEQGDLANRPPSKQNLSDRHLALSISKSTIFGVAASATQVGTRLITVPIVIYHLGLGGYGIWSIIMTTAAYMRFGTAGVKSAFQKYVAEATETGDFQTANKLLSTGSFSMLILSIAGLIPVCVFSDELARMSGVPFEFDHAAAGAITVLALTLMIANFGSAFEAIVMGAHRIDLVRKFNIATTVCEALAIVTLLRLGYGLLAMALVMGTAELVYIFCCFLAARQILPEIQLSIALFRRDVFPELVRFAGSYQLVAFLEVLYLAILPIFILRCFGADYAGVYAVATRVAGSALLAQDALILPLLSGGTVVFASGSVERMNRFLERSLKAMLAVTLLPLAFVAAFGPTLVRAWTGEVGRVFGTAIALVALANLLKAISLLQLVLYRTTGKALLDNIRQVLRIVLILGVALLGTRLGFNGILTGLVVAELAGVIFMFFAMSITFSGLSPRAIGRDAFRLVIATGIVLLAGFAVATFPISGFASGRAAAAVKLCEVGVACLLAAWPALTVTGSVSVEEQRLVLDAVMPWRRRSPATDE